MKIKDLMALLVEQDPEKDLLIADNGSILQTSSLEAMIEYNQGNDTPAYFITTEEY